MIQVPLTYCHRCHSGYPLCEHELNESRKRMNPGDIYLLAAYEIWKSYGDINLEEILKSFEGQSGYGVAAGQRSSKMEKALLPPVEYPAKGRKPRVIEKRRFETYSELKTFHSQKLFDELDGIEPLPLDWKEESKKWKEYNEYLEKTVNILIDIYIGSY